MIPKSVNTIVLLIIILLTDILAIHQIFQFWQTENNSMQGFSVISVIAAQIAIAAALLFCAVFVFYKSYLSK